jgi:hypothetical protein
MSEIEFGGQLTEAEFGTVNALALRKLRLVVRLFGILYGFINLASFSWDQLTEQPLAYIFIWISIFLFISGGWPIDRLVVRRYWRNNKLLQKPVSGTVSEEGISWNVEGFMSSNIPWSLFMKHRVSPLMILVYQGPNQVYYFPRRYFHSDSDWIEFHKLVISKVPSK